MSDSDKDLVHDAWLEVMSDPEKYSDFHIELAESLEFKFKTGEQKNLTAKQKIKSTTFWRIKWMQI
jgi:hypothetical protein